EVSRLELSICLPHIVNECVLRKLPLQPVTGLSLPLPVGTVVEPGLSFDLLHCLGVVFSHPPIDVVEKCWIVPNAEALQPAHRQSLSDARDRGTTAAIASPSCSSPFSRGQSRGCSCS